MSPDLVKEYDSVTNYGKLPARVKKSKKPKSQKASPLLGPDKVKDPTGY